MKHLAALPAALTLGLLASLMPACNTVKAPYTADGQGFPLASMLEIVSPCNATYDNGLLTLNVTFKTLLSPESVALSYSIDGEANVTLQIEAKRSPIEAEIIFANGTIVKGFSIQSPFIITSSTNLPELNEGMHNITVYAEYRANNIVGLDNATVYFTILGMRQPPASNYTEISEGTVEACENPQSTSSTFFPNHNSCSAQNEPTPKPRSESPSHQTASPQTEFIDLATATLTAVAVAVTVMLAKKAVSAP